MKAITFKEFKGPLSIEELPKPYPRPDEVQIAVEYVGVNPVDWKIHEGYLKNVLPHEFPLIPGWDVAGKISDVGEEVTNLKVGDEVYAYCRKPTVQWGTYADYVCFDAKFIAKKPNSLSIKEAAGIPLVALTAWQALFDHGKLQSGQTVLIHAGAGGVGSLAIAFAHHAGAKVYTTASAKNHSYVKNLGADVAIDYTQEDFREQLQEKVDVVFDCAGGDALEKSYDVVKKGGRLLSIVNPPNPARCEELGIHGEYLFVSPNGEQLQEIAKLIDAKKVQPPHIQEMSFKEYEKAWDQLKDGHTQGKIVLRFREG